MSKGGDKSSNSGILSRHAQATAFHCRHMCLSGSSVAAEDLLLSLTFFISALVAKIIRGRVGIVQYHERRSFVAITIGSARQGTVESIPCFFSTWIAQNVGIILAAVTSKIELIHGIDTGFLNLFKYNRFRRKDAHLFPKAQCRCNLLLSRVKVSAVRFGQQAKDVR